MRNSWGAPMHCSPWKGGSLEFVTFCGEADLGEPFYSWLGYVAMRAVGEEVTPNDAPTLLFVWIGRLMTLRATSAEIVALFQASQKPGEPTARFSPRTANSL